MLDPNSFSVIQEPEMSYMPRRYINLALMLAFMLAGISPACKFIAGAGNAHAASGFIEICTTDGLQTIAVTAAQNPESPQQPDEKFPAVGTDCLFCFAAAHAKALDNAQILPLSAIFQGANAPASLHGFVPHQRGAGPFQPRGPPSLS